MPAQSEPDPIPASEKFKAWEYVISADDPGWSTESLPYYSTSMVHPSDAWGIDGWVPVEFPRLLLSGDYVGDSVTESNRRVFLEEYGSIPGVYEFSEGYGARGVLLTPWALAWVIEGDPVMDYGIDTRPVSQYGPEYWRSRIKTLRDVLARLEDYPALDEEAWSEVEREREDEAWDSWARADLERELTRQFPACEDIFEHREVSRDAFEVWADKANVYWTHETGNSCYIDLERIVKTLTVKDLVDAGYGLIEDHAAARLTGENL